MGPVAADGRKVPVAVRAAVFAVVAERHPKVEPLLEPIVVGQRPGSARVDRAAVGSVVKDSVGAALPVEHGGQNRVGSDGQAQFVLRSERPAHSDGGRFFLREQSCGHGCQQEQQQQFLHRFGVLAGFGYKYRIIPPPCKKPAVYLPSGSGFSARACRGPGQKMVSRFWSFSSRSSLSIISLTSVSILEPSE